MPRKQDTDKKRRQMLIARLEENLTAQSDRKNMTLGTAYADRIAAALNPNNTTEDKKA